MYATLIQPLITIAQRAAVEILDVYNHASDLEIQTKGDDSPLTIADQRSNNVINDGLKSLPIQYPIISEENKLVDYETRQAYEYYWLVDPLDGTKEFIKRNGEFTVNIALIHKNTPVMGVVNVPAQNRTFWSIKGQGAFLVNHADDQTTTLQVNTFNMADAGLRVVTSRSHLNEATEAYVEQLHDPQFVPVGSSLKFLILAEGKADVYPRFGPCMEWDTAAAQIILEEAGGKVVHTDHLNAPLVYNKENLLNPFFIAFGNC